ncbi:MAG: Hsp70 family protein [Micromonosporaceae bacterium]
MSFDLAVDYGTSNTVAVLRWPDGRVRPLLFDGSPLLPSAVFATPDGRIAVGRDAQRSAGLDPARYEPYPKRHIDAGELLLGERAYPITELIAAVLRRVADEAVRTAGGPPVRAILTCPAAWGATRRGTLNAAASRASLPVGTLLPEPVAAATYFSELVGARVGPGQSVLVYDLGAGTFDASVVRRSPTGFEVLSVAGMDDFGGVDLDKVVIDQAGAAVAAAAPADWRRLNAPRTPEERRGFRTLWDDARGAKEMLSRQPVVGLHVPLLDRDVHVTREEFERAAREQLSRTAGVALEALRQSRIERHELAGIFLVGGSSRIPLVATLLHQRIGVPATAIEQPELVVAEGALLAIRANGPPTTAPTSPAAAPGSPVAAPTGVTSSVGTPAPPVPPPSGPPPSASPFGPPPGPLGMPLRSGAVPPGGLRPPVVTPVSVLRMVARNKLLALVAAGLVGVLVLGLVVWSWIDTPDDAFGSDELLKFAGKFAAEPNTCAPATDATQYAEEVGGKRLPDVVELVRCEGDGWIVYFYGASTDNSVSRIRYGTPAPRPSHSDAQYSEPKGSADYVGNYREWRAPEDRPAIYWEHKDQPLMADLIGTKGGLDALRRVWLDHTSGTTQGG